MNQYYPHLFQPLRVNTMMLKNRIIASTMGIPRAMNYYLRLTMEMLVL